MLTARSYNDKQLDTIARSVFYNTLKLVQRELAKESINDDVIIACAVTLEAASAGFDTAEPDALEPAEMLKASPYNDDLLNEVSRSIYVTAMTEIQKYAMGDSPMNTDRMHAYARIADAAASGFAPDSDEETE